MKVAALALACAGTAAAQSLAEALSGRSDLSQLASLVQPYAQQFSSMNNITLLAPNNDAIGAALNTSTGMMLSSNPDLLQAVLSYHVIMGNYSNVTELAFLPTSLMQGAYANVTGGQVVEASPMDGNVTFFSGLLQNSSVVSNGTLSFSGGTIHIIDRLLTLPQNVSTTAVAANLTSAAGALMTLNLTETADTTADLTLFIPNNAAFQRIGGNLANLSTDELTSILTYHVVPSVVYSTDIMNGTSVMTLNGANVTLRLEGEDVYVNGARVVQPNVLVSNGVVHVIDRVLNPMNATQTPNTSMTEEAFAGATSASDEPFTSGVPTPTSAVATARASGSSSSAGAFRPIETGALGMAALFGGAAAILNM